MQCWHHASIMATTYLIAWSWRVNSATCVPWTIARSAPDPWKYRQGKQGPAKPLRAIVVTEAASCTPQRPAGNLMMCAVGTGCGDGARHRDAEYATNEH